MKNYPEMYPSDENKYIGGMYEEEEKKNTYLVTASVIIEVDAVDKAEAEEMAYEQLMRAKFTEIDGFETEFWQ